MVAWQHHCNIGPLVDPLPTDEEVSMFRGVFLIAEAGDVFGGVLINKIPGSTTEVLTTSHPHNTVRFDDKLCG